MRGVANLLFHATDVGAGVYRSIVSVDGAEVSRRAVAAGAAQCADVEPSDEDPYQFATPQPCPLDAAGEAQLDTHALRDGDHLVRVSVEDAAGNVDVVHEGTVTTHNAPIATAAPAIAGALRSGATVSVGSGQWDGAPTAWGYRWLRCDADGTSCAGVAGADGPAYALTAADAYHRVVAEVTAENAAGATAARSAVSGVVADADGRLAPPPPTATTTGGDGATALSPDTAGIAGLTNPLAILPGHVANGAAPDNHPRLEIGFQLADGRSVHRVRSPRTRRWRIVGRLLDGAGHPIAGARLNVAWRVSGRGWRAHGGARSGADGRVAVTLPPGPSRAVKLTYFPYSDSRTFTVSNVIVQDALAQLSIQATPRRVGGARVVRLSGRVSGELLPRGGLLVALEGYQAGFGWHTFTTVRTARDGRWSTRYRFRLSHGRFGFRAVVPRQGSFPFATSRSPAVTVVVA